MLYCPHDRGQFQQRIFEAVHLTSQRSNHQRPWLHRPPAQQYGSQRPGADLHERAVLPAADRAVRVAGYDGAGAGESAEL